MSFKEDITDNANQAEIISELLERESRRYNHGFSEEDEARER